MVEIALFIRLLKRYSSLGEVISACYKSSNYLNVNEAPKKGTVDFLLETSNKVQILYFSFKLTFSFMWN